MHAYKIQNRFLRNKLGIRDPEELAAVEHAAVGIQRIRLTTRSLPGAFGTAHLQRFHRVLFGDIYDWAGTIRNVTAFPPSTPPSSR
ncbi:hypothetical protein [Frankia sp. CiP1_Cm_nod1]|uniref:hypothetical protein n=1 Tax=Frankia sp. CiP1_Cm_nod1 TaxID=2897160 RepID=UPI0020244A57